MMTTATGETAAGTTAGTTGAAPNGAGSRPAGKRSVVMNGNAVTIAPATNMIVVTTITIGATTGMISAITVVKRCVTPGYQGVSWLQRPA